MLTHPILHMQNTGKVFSLTFYRIVSYSYKSELTDHKDYIDYNSHTEKCFNISTNLCTSF